MSRLVGALLLGIYLCSLVSTIQLSSLDFSARSRVTLHAESHIIRTQGLILDTAVLENLSPSEGMDLSLTGDVCLRPH
jgi:hypothetical protein